MGIYVIIRVLFLGIRKAFMKLRKSEIIALLIILISIATAVYFYPRVPDRIPSHWNYKGEIDQHMTRFWGLFIMPIVLIAMYLLFIILPRIDPLKANILKFRKYFDGFIILILLFMLFIQYFIALSAQGINIKPHIFMPIALGILFFYIGILLQNAKRNWFIGIRNPWTMSSDAVWDKTHQLGGKLFKTVGVISILSILLGKYAFAFVIIPIIISLIYVTIYSYRIYKKETG
jgi:uncharacterized membrane protein